MSLQNIEAVSNKIVNRIHNSDKAKVSNNNINTCADRTCSVYSGKYFLTTSSTILDYAEFDTQSLKRMKTTIQEIY